MVMYFFNACTHPVYYERQPSLLTPLKYTLNNNLSPSKLAKNVMYHMSTRLMNETESSSCPWCWFCCWKQRRPIQGCVSFPLCHLQRGSGLYKVNEKLLFHTLVFIIEYRSERGLDISTSLNFEPELYLTHEQSIHHIVMWTVSMLTQTRSTHRCDPRSHGLQVDPHISTAHHWVWFCCEVSTC